jgi:hypothetical protein
MIVRAPTYVRGHYQKPSFILLDCIATSASDISNPELLESALGVANAMSSNAPGALCILWFICGSSDYVHTFYLTPGDIQRVEERKDWQQHKYAVNAPYLINSI